VYDPSLLLAEDMYSMFSTTDDLLLDGWAATVSATTWALAPG